jgi:putative hydrolase of the HAD superfamily
MTGPVTQPAAIKTLLFDLGGVIMDIRRQDCIDALRGLGMAHPEELLGDYAQKGVFMLLESGQISADGFRAELRLMIDREVTDAELDEAFQRFLVGIPRHRLAMLRSLRRRYGVYMLSNTNPIMWEGRIAEEFRQEGLELDDYFDGVVTSFEAGSMKPDEGIFIHAIKRLGLDPATTLFVDDSQANLDAAARLGFATALVEPGREVADALSSFLNL